MNNLATRNDREVGSRSTSFAGPFDGIVDDVDVQFNDGVGRTLVLPAFQAGDGTVRVRFAAPRPDGYDYVTRSGDARVDRSGVGSGRGHTQGPIHSIRMAASRSRRPGEPWSTPTERRSSGSATRGGWG